MPPPPPPSLGRARKRAAHIFDAALDDTELVAARASLARGRWTDVRTLLAATHDDWDRRGHRVTVLAQEPAALAWARDWQLAEPESPSASVLVAHAVVHRALRGKDRPEAARAACRAAAELAPEDPTPWLGLLILEQSLGREDDVLRLFDEVRTRYPDHHHAHHLVVARLAERRPDTGQDPLHEVYDFANWAAEQAPGGLAARHPPGRRARGALPRPRRRRYPALGPRRLRALGGAAGPPGDEGRVRLVAGVGT